MDDYEPSGWTGDYANSQYEIIVNQNRLETLDEEIREVQEQLAQDPNNQSLLDNLQGLNNERELIQTGLTSASTNANDIVSGNFGEIGDHEENPDQIEACVPWKAGTWGSCISLGLAWVVNILLWIFGSLLWVASRIFDLSVFVSISSLGDWFKSPAVANAWRVLRDLANLSFVFILLYIALNLVFNSDLVKGGIKKLVVNVIIVALLVNFSGFFVRVVVDASNVIAYEFYTQLGGTTELTTGQTIGMTLMQKLRMDRYFINDTDPNSPQIQTLSISKVILQGLGNIFIILATSFVLLVAALLFVIRTVVLLMVYVFSPLALASYALPNNSSFNFFNKWKDALIKQAFFAPAFLVPLFVVFTLIGENGIANFTATGGALLGFGGLLLVMSNILILGLIIGSIFIAQKIGAVGLGAATAFGSGGLGVGTRGLSRIGRGIGSGLARTELGKKTIEGAGNLANRVPGSARLRQSWNTGILSDVKRSNFGQKTSQALSRPVASSVGGLARGISMATGIKGVGLENITGATTFSKAVEDKAGKIYEEMKKIESPADRVKFIEGLSGVTQREEFNALYTKLTPEERVKLEKEAAAGSPVAKRLAEQRLTLKGKAAQDTATEMIKEFKGADKLKAIEHLEVNDFNSVYKTIKAQDRADIERFAVNNQKVQDKIAEAKTKLSTKNFSESKKTERILEAFNTINENIPFAAPVVAFNQNNPASSAAMARIEKIRALNEEEFKEFMEENRIFDGNHRDLYPYLTASQLKAITKVGIPRDEIKEIKQAITLHRGPGKHHDNALESAYKYMGNFF
ncbi:MAG: hypothetical protein COV08_03645 [Candidatus Vogelbacteria bacterium CG10_big_fil_rev_8_21_14_0_10_49_38]|uniref:Uncharacterized protein n=1 Tax=Candidatus Vogelbacteria bacterium CG10_big_fil_rev_8_21_14_0_10_49_38 TaxID=1975043 RepID=A0A2H0RGQ8_9BACT|nr:MAG: hypothetical protein BK006_03635 [bacterium CG10_49_38]PIR45729.1 MAG: hypothetical protein COV08_03645 [Candidatus Vogelbacteria bacterium CG10_big_fil_rev_8_21_14_0_10_49_38]